MDPSGLFIATAAQDKTIRMYDFLNGELLTKVRVAVLRESRRRDIGTAMRRWWWGCGLSGGALGGRGFVRRPASAGGDSVDTFSLGGAQGSSARAAPLAQRVTK